MKVLLTILISIMSFSVFSCDIGVNQQGIGLDVKFKSMGLERDIAHCVSIVTKRKADILLSFNDSEDTESFLYENLQSKEDQTYNLCIRAARECQNKVSSK